MKQIHFIQYDDRDKEYAEARNLLIPEAAERAEALVKAFGKRWDWRKGADGKRFRWDRWTEFFHKEMNTLAKERL